MPMPNILTSCVLAPGRNTRSGITYGFADGGIEGGVDDSPGAGPLYAARGAVDGEDRVFADDWRRWRVS
jgi:hypothetical protein